MRGGERAEQADKSGEETLVAISMRVEGRMVAPCRIPHRWHLRKFEVCYRHESGGLMKLPRLGIFPPLQLLHLHNYLGTGALRHSPRPSYRGSSHLRYQRLAHCFEPNAL